MNKYLGIDYGTTHVGLASSEHMLATPLFSLENSPALIPKLAALIQKEGITHIICGIPEGIIAPKVIEFAGHLESATGLKVELHPETLSTKEAVAGLRASGASRAKLKNDHVYAACLILEDYLELKNSVN
jgi:putative transcription antitermination factor YqgF